MDTSRTQIPEETPLNRNAVEQGVVEGREVGTWKRDSWQRSLEWEQKGDKSHGREGSGKRC